MCRLLKFSNYIITVKLNWSRLKKVYNPSSFKIPKKALKVDMIESYVSKGFRDEIDYNCLLKMLKLVSL